MHHRHLRIGEIRKLLHNGAQATSGGVVAKQTLRRHSPVPVRARMPCAFCKLMAYVKIQHVVAYLVFVELLPTPEESGQLFFHEDSFAPRVASPPVVLLPRGMTWYCTRKGAMQRYLAYTEYRSNIALLCSCQQRSTWVEAR